MSFVTPLTERDRQLVSCLQDFVPAEIYDIHAHPFHPDHFAPGSWKAWEAVGILGCEAHRGALQQYMSASTLHGLYFPVPHRTADRPRANAWVSEEVAAHGTPLSRSLRLVAPADDRDAAAGALRQRQCCGFKVYHCYADRPDTMQARISDFAPEWMWEILHEQRGLLMLHIVRDGGISDPDNQAELARLCRAYPNVRLILAHVARSFNYRHAREGLRAIADLDQAVVDTSAICEADAFRAALDILGPRRILWGSDFAVSEARGRCVATGDLFYWLHPDSLRPEAKPPTSSEMTLVGIESLLCLREACTDAGLTAGDIDDLFRNNALRTLAPWLPEKAVPKQASGPELWQRARQSISGGTGLLSKRAEMFDARSWPSYFSRCSGCEVWDLDGRRYLDFAGGIGAVLLGYADRDVSRAVRRQLSRGTYCSLVSLLEVELAEKLLKLHPWAGKVRYARGGGEAMTVAVRVARAATGKSGVAFCGYHGWHDWYLAANLGEARALDGHLLPGLEPRGVPRELRGTSVPFRYNDPSSLEEALRRLDGNLAAVVMEPMRSQFPKDDFVARAAALCRAAGAVFVVDEITSGLRYGFPGALSRLGVDPDIAVYAKATGNGFPFAAVIGREEVMAAADGSFISSSYWTDGIGPAAALATLDKIERLDVSAKVWQRGEAFQKDLRQVAARHAACRVIIGGMPATPTLNFDLGPDTPLAQALYVRGMQQRGFLASSVFYLMLAHQDVHYAAFLESLDAVLASIAAHITAGDLEPAAGVVRGQRGFARLT